MDIKNFDLSIIKVRSDGSYVINNGFYHVPNEGEWADLWAQVDAYAKEHPEVVTEEQPYVAPEPTEAEIIDGYKAHVQAALDAFAATRGYDDIHTAASYNTSSDAQFALEGKYCDELRTTTWRRCWDILAKVKAGEMPQPTKEELVAMLPVGSAKWPDEE